MEKELESVHRCVATKPHGLVCFPRLTLKAVGGMSRMEIDRSYRSSRVTEECIPSWKEMQKLRERERGQERLVATTGKKKNEHSLKEKNL